MHALHDKMSEGHILKIRDSFKWGDARGSFHSILSLDIS